jgi:hypothetical protein
MNLNPSKNHMDTSAGAEELQAVFQRLPTASGPTRKKIDLCDGDALDANRLTRSPRSFFSSFAL